MISQQFGAICPGRSLGPDNSLLRSFLTLIGDESGLALLEPPRTGFNLNLQDLMDSDALVAVQKEHCKCQPTIEKYNEPTRKPEAADRPVLSPQSVVHILHIPSLVRDGHLVFAFAGLS